MKAASIVFVILGMILSISLEILLIVDSMSAKLTGFIILSIILMLLTFVFGIAALVTMASDNKSIFVGIMCILFLSLLGGIFYLCWSPYSYSSSYASRSTTSLYRSSSSTKVIQQKTKTDELLKKAELIEKYNNLRNSNAITQEQFETIKQQILGGEKVENLNKQVPTNLSVSVSTTDIPHFDLDLYKNDLNNIRIGKTNMAIRDFNKLDCCVEANKEYRVTAKFGNKFQIMVDGKFLNLEEAEFAYIFLKKD